MLLYADPPSTPDRVSDELYRDFYALHPNEKDQAQFKKIV